MHKISSYIFFQSYIHKSGLLHSTVDSTIVDMSENNNNMLFDKLKDMSTKDLKPCINSRI